MISTINEAIEYAKANSLHVLTFEPVSEAEIEDCEKAIGYRLPESYVSFVKEFGFGVFGSLEFYGLKSDDIKAASPYNALSRTLELHGTGDLPTDMFAIENIDSCYTCLKLSEMREGECPVVLWEFGTYVRDDDPEPYRILADSFNSYFIQEITLRVEWQQMEPEKREEWKG